MNGRGRHASSASPGEAMTSAVPPTGGSAFSMSVARLLRRTPRRDPCPRPELMRWPAAYLSKKPCPATHLAIRRRACCCRVVCASLRHGLPPTVLIQRFTARHEHRQRVIKQAGPVFTSQ